MNARILAAERQRRIVSIVERQGSARIVDLAAAFFVTDETIRRDLEILEEEGKLLRRRGGAITLGPTNPETPFAEREMRNLREKTAIASRAVRRVLPGNTILLDASTTALQVAALLPDIPLTVVTNSVRIVLELAARSHVTCICLGGSLSADSLSFLGPVAEAMLHHYHFDRLFLSCKGFDLKRGCSDPNEWQARLKHSMLPLADRRYLLVDHTKIGVRALSVFAQAGDFHEIISDDPVDPTLRRELEAMGVQVTAARPAQ